MIARRLVICGRVQGVGYREGMIDAAQAFGVAGWVRNRADGTVEAWVQGDAERVERAIAWCRRGPSMARVSGIDVVEESVSPAIVSFTHRRTE